MAKIVLVSLVHNRKHLVGLAIKSALMQNLSKEKWIHLLIDNASDDGARQACEEYEKMFSHIKLIKMDYNMGQQPAFNYVLNEWLPKNAPEAKILVNLDSDDELVPNALYEVEKMFDEHPEIGQIYSGFDIIDGQSRTTHKNHAKARLVPNQFTAEGQKTLRRLFISQNPIGHLRAFRINCLREIGGFNTTYTYATDYNAAGRMLMKFPVVKIDKVLYRWRQHNDQVERHSSPQQTKDWQDMQKEFAELFKKNNLI